MSFNCSFRNKIHILPRLNRHNATAYRRQEDKAIILEGFQVESRDRFKLFTNQKLLAGAVKGICTDRQLQTSENTLKDNFKLQTFDVMLKKGGKDSGMK